MINRTETQGGQKVAIAELFGWPYADIEKECVFLGKAGWGGVRIWPPSEAVFSDFWAQSGERKWVFITIRRIFLRLNADGYIHSPWWFVYQPVSYRLNSRHGTVTALRSMITTCRANGVRVYADAVVNHMVSDRILFTLWSFNRFNAAERRWERHPKPPRLRERRLWTLWTQERDVGQPVLHAHFNVSIQPEDGTETWGALNLFLC